MGRIKTKRIKRITEALYTGYKGEFKETFTDNKLVVGKYTDVENKKMRNVIAGYATRLARNRKEL
jgi:small subunit ribosomal protein S17e